MYFRETKSEGKCGLNNSAVGRKFVSLQLLSAKPVGMRLTLRLAVVAALLVAAVRPAHGQTESVLYSFANTPDGANPLYVTPVLDAKQNIYGTTKFGGTDDFGTAWELTPSGAETVLHSFHADGTDGVYPLAGVVLGKKGILYGTTVEGGTNSIDGTMFQLTPKKKSWTEAILHSFGAIGDGAQPYDALTLDKNGNLYGTTYGGGTYSFGTVFERTPSGTETVLWSFGNGTDGANPIAGVIRDAKGNVYGTTEYGGLYNQGTVFELTPTMNGWTEAVLWSFGSGTDGANPYGGVVLGKKGILYGTTINGGDFGDGTVFALTPTKTGWTEKILHSFANNDIDGFNPAAGLLMDKKTGNFYGTALNGGGTGSVAGIVFKITPSGAYAILHVFSGSPDGGSPWGGLASDKLGNLYGTTFSGGTNGYGTVYKVTP